MDVWTHMDFQNGLISDPAMIGKPVYPQPPSNKTAAAPEQSFEMEQSSADQQSAAAEDLPAPETFEPFTPAVRKAKAIRTLDRMLHKADTDFDGALSDGSSQLNKVLDWAIKATAEDSTDADLSALTARHLARLPDEQFTAGLVRAFGGIQTAVRDALRASGADPYAVDCLAILRAAVALDDDLLDRMRDEA